MIYIRNSGWCEFPKCTRPRHSELRYKCYFCKYKILSLIVCDKEHIIPDNYRMVCKPCEPKTKIFPELDFEYVIDYI